MWLLKEKMFIPKGHYGGRGGGEGWVSKLNLVILWESHQNKMKTLAFESTRYCGHWGRDDWIWSRFAGGCLTSVFVSELSKGRKGLLLLFSCAQSTYLFLPNEFSKGTQANRNWTLDLLTIDFACLKTEISHLWQHLGSNENIGLQGT